MPPISTKPETKQEFSTSAIALDEYYETPSGKKFVLYHTNWATYGRNFQVKDLPIDYIPEIAYAFFNVDAYGNITSGDTWADFDKRFTDPATGVQPLDDWNSNSGYYGNLGQFRKLKEGGKKFNLTLSIGGWSWSKFFSSAVNSANRTNFVNNIITILQRYGIFCGVSIDWEYPTNDGVNHGNQGNESRREDTFNLIETIKLLKLRLASINKQHYKISICCSANPIMVKVGDLPNICKVADELHVMTYDFSDYRFSKPVSSPHCNLKKCDYSNFSVEEMVDALLLAGIESTKIFIGVAFYSRGFGGTDGPGKSASAPSPDKSWEDGIVDYKSLPVSGAVEYWDQQSMSVFSYDKDKRIYNSYDNINSVYYKSKYVFDKNLGGILVWESSGDRPSNDPRCLTVSLNKFLIKKELEEPPLPKVWGETLPQPVLPPKTPEIPKVPEVPSKPVLIPFWEENKVYNISDTVIYQGKYYKCRIKHTSNSGWLPNLTNGTLWVNIDSPINQPPIVRPPIDPLPIIKHPIETPPKEDCNCADKVINHLNKMKFKVDVNVSFDDIIDSYTIQ
jgi:chitinase